MSNSKENSASEAAGPDMTVVVDVVQPQSHYGDQEDLRAIIQNLRAEVKELNARFNGIGENKEDLGRAAAVFDVVGKGVLQDGESPKRVLTNHNEMPLVEGAADMQSKNKPEIHDITAEPKQSGTEPVPGSRIRYRTVTVSPIGVRVESDGRPPNPRNVTDSDADIAFEAKEIFDEESKATSYEITLKSKGLRSVVWKVIGDWILHEKATGQKIWLANDQVWPSPFIFAMHYWTEFEAEANNMKFKDDQPHQDLKELLMYIEAVQPEKVKYRRELEILETIPNDCVWMLFRSGSLIVTKPDVDQIHHQVLQVHSHRYITEPREREMMLVPERVTVVLAWAFDWNGSELVRRYFEFQLRSRVDETHIRDLPCWPLRYMYHENVGESDEKSAAVMRDTLVKRGREMREHCVLRSGRNRMCNFQGVVQLWENEPEPEDRFFIQKEPKTTTHKISNKPIMVDFEAYREFYSGFPGFGSRKANLITPCTCSYCVSPRRKKWIEAFNDPQKTNEELLGKGEADSWLLLPYRLLGYAIQDRFWAQFPVAGITKYIHQDQDAYDKVLFPASKVPQKDALRSLVLSHLSARDGEKPDGYWVSDFIQREGPRPGGLVACGLGKTSTAESLAKVAERPLLKISASDIGSTAKSSEENLKKYFRLATSWEAIILLDEADVFLETRGTPGEKVFERNALVAVMLRILEYFDGILFLTTNRIMKLDIAMLSRIHYAIHFTDLMEDQEIGIWNEQLQQLDVKKGNVTYTEKERIEKWVEKYLRRPRGVRFDRRIGLNGREIHNIFKTAQHIANGDNGRKVTLFDLREAIHAVESFRSEMRDRVEKAERQLVVRDEQLDS